MFLIFITYCVNVLKTEIDYNLNFKEHIDTLSENNFCLHLHHQLILNTGGFRSSPPVVFLVKDVLKKYSKFTGEHPYRSVISIKLFYNFIEITLRHGGSPVKLQHFSEHRFQENPWKTASKAYNEFLLNLSLFIFSSGMVLSQPRNKCSHQQNS